MNFKLGLHLFSRKSTLNIMLIILIALSLLIVNICLGMFNEETSLLDSVQGFDKENDYYFMYTQNNLFFGDDDSENLLEKDLINAVDNDNFHLGIMYHGNSEIRIKQAFNTSLAKYKYVTFFGFDNYTLNCLNYNQLISGVWCTKAKHQDGYLNVVALEGSYNVGDTFEMELSRKYYEYDDEGEVTSYGYEPFKIKCLVTGVIKGGGYILNGNTMSNDLSLSQFMKPTFTDKINGEKSVIYFSYEDELLQDFLNDERPSEQLSPCAFLHFDDSISETEIYKIRENLSKIGWVVSIQDICNKSEQEIMSVVLELIPFMFGIFLLTVICLICMITLNAMDHMKTYAVYYLCGMNWGDMKKILFSYALIVMVSSLVLFGLLFVGAWYLMGMNQIMLLKPNNLYVTLGIILVMILIFVFVPYILLSRSSPKDALRNNLKS
ncbi:MAG: FtsX-like permease family protein [Acutalibacteraceae bacterium]